jgi:phage terminase large subunit
MFSATTATRRIMALDKRIQIVAGGTSASKTISNLLKLIHLSQTDKTPKLSSIVSESMPHLKRGAMRDFLNIMTAHGYFKEEAWNRSDFIYTFETGSKIEFFSADQPSKTRGPRRDRLFLNEGNNIPYEAADQMMVRTKELIIIDYNPTNEFWAYTEIMQNPLMDGKYDFITLTYKDNEALDPAIVESIESHRINKAWWTVYGEGKLGEVEGKIFTNWKIIDEVPHEARLEVRGLDFGYAQDPAALCDIYRYNGGYIVDELIHRKGMKNRQLADVILNQYDPNCLTIADSAEPKSIDEMREYGVNIIGVEKRGSGGINFTNSAIQFVQAQQMSITKRSINFLHNYRNFMWQTDRITGKPLPKYDHFESDGMMAVVYAMTNFSPREEDEVEYNTGNLGAVWL